MNKALVAALAATILSSCSRSSSSEEIVPGSVRIPDGPLMAKWPAQSSAPSIETTWAVTIEWLSTLYGGTPTTWCQALEHAAARTCCDKPLLNCNISSDMVAFNRVLLERCGLVGEARVGWMSEHTLTLEIDRNRPIVVFLASSASPLLIPVIAFRYPSKGQWEYFVVGDPLRRVGEFGPWGSPWTTGIAGYIYGIRKARP